MRGMWVVGGLMALAGLCRIAGAEDQGPVTFHGRVVHGMTGKPMVGALVIAYSGVHEHANLAELDARDWKQLHALARQPKVDDDRLQPVSCRYTLHAVARTDEQGRYELAWPGKEKCNWLLAVEEEFIPLQCGVAAIKPVDGKADVPDMGLHPAARVMVKPVVRMREDLAICPKWILEDKDRPTRFALYRLGDDGVYQKPECAYWLRVGQAQPVFVPAAVRVRLWLEVPYDEKWATAEPDRVFELRAGESAELGDVEIRPAVPVQVRVVDARGKALAGIPVRRVEDRDDAWTLDRRTGRDGMVTVYVTPNTTGRIAILDQRACVLKEATYKVDEAAPTEPVGLVLGDGEAERAEKPDGR